MRSEELQLKIDMLPESPGCYLMKHEGQIIYVGKAVNLKNRVRSYFQRIEHTPKVTAMIEKIDDFDIILCQTNLEALMLECNLIKLHKPFYNILLKDDKHYPYIRVDLEESYPRIQLARRMEKDGAKYFGPYMGATGVRQVLEAIRQVFPLRTCTMPLPLKTPRRPCVNYEIGRCLAPCAEKCTREQYDEVLKEALLFLSGKYQSVTDKLQKEMLASSKVLNFERAAVLRDKIKDVTQLSEKQRAIQTRNQGAQQDVLAVAADGLDAMVQVLYIRSGHMVAGDHFVLAGEGMEAPGEILSAFMTQYYDDGNLVPRQVLVSDLPEGSMEALESFLRQKREGAVDLLCPHRGDKHDLILLAQKNAADALEKRNARAAVIAERTTGASKALADAIGMKTIPRRIEGYDISNTQGVLSVGSMVVFINGQPAKKEYRQFRIKTVEGPNDFASMNEVLTRRFAHGVEEKKQREEAGLPAIGGKFSDLPDLVLIDGGPVQLAYARRAMHAAGADVPMFGLAKRLEEIYLPGQEETIYLDRRSPALYLIQRVRDEAHRFGITAHRALRTKAGLHSQLEDIPGVGPKRRAALIKHFHTLTAIRQADMETLMEAPGMTRDAARAVYAWAHTEKEGETE